MWLLLFFVSGWLVISIGWAPAGVQEFVSRRILGRQEQTPAASAPTPDAASPPATTAQRIIISAVGIDAAVVSPESRDFTALNRALQQGVVHYPGSPGPGERGNMFLFGHSTALPVVRNPAYQAFNRIQHLRAGDTVRLQTSDREYWYAVRSVTVRQAHDAEINFIADGALLTLSSCNVLGAKEDRFVVEAEFVGSYPLQSGMRSTAADTSS